MGRKTYVIDTNVLLHDPEAISKFHENDVVLPLVVLEELDKLKRYTDELGKNAKQVLRYIDELTTKGNLYQGISLENNIKFSIFMDYHGERKGFSLPLDNPKNKILFTAYLLKQQGKDVVVLVSKDFVLRVKAESIGIHAQDYLNLKNSYEDMYKGIRRLQIPKRDIDEVFTKGMLHVEGEQFYPNEYCILHSKENSSAICKYNPGSGLLEPIPQMHKDIWGIKPLNEEQRCALDLLLRDDVKLITLIGQAGTGKTMLALTCGLRKVFDEDVYKKILISRPIMPLGKDIGYLPGSKEEKICHWMQPIYDNLDYVCESTSGEENVQATKNWIMETEKIEMEAVTYIRGRSLSRTYIIIDEAQNLSPHEVKTIISRAGKGTKVILTGDPTQIDNPYLDKDSNALTYLVGRFKDQKIYGNIFLTKTERSELAAIAADIL